MPKSIVRTDDVIEGKGLYSQCIRAGDTVYISGQVAWDRDGNVLGVGDVGTQARRCFAAISSLLAAAEGTLDDVVKVNMYLRRIDDAPVVRGVRAEFFKAPYPAWTTVEVSALLTPELLIEVDAVAALRSGSS